MPQKACLLSFCALPWGPWRPAVQRAVCLPACLRCLPAGRGRWIIPSLPLLFCLYFGLTLSGSLFSPFAVMAGYVMEKQTKIGQ